MSHKTFRHNLVVPIELTTETIDGKRHYVLPDGLHKFKSVTTILGEKTDKSAITAWQNRVGIEQATKISTQAARRGTAVHSMAEKYILNEENIYGDKPMPINIESFKPLKSVLDDHVDDIYGVELALYSKVLKCAGRTDLVAHYDGIPSIIDFKTSKRLKREDWIENYFLQSTVYSMMFESLYKIEIPQIAILITVDDEPNAQVFVKDRSQYVQRVLEIFA